MVKHIGSYTPWREQLDIHIASEDWADQWLEGGGEEATRTTQRVATPLPRLHRPQSFEARKASAVKSQDWDENFANAKNHVAGILSKLGNGK
jgi:hypothetical protein